MTGAEVLALAKQRVKNSNPNAADWVSFFDLVTDEIFAKDYKFAQQELNYIHPQDTFEYTFDTTASEMALTKIIAARHTESFSTVGAQVIPATNSILPLTFLPLKKFRETYPDEQFSGVPHTITELHGPDGTNGMQIGIYPRPTTDAAIWIDGIFIPTVNNDTAEIAVVPKQFHRIYIHGIAYWAASQSGQDKLASQEYAFFQRILAELKAWDLRNPNHRLRLKSPDELGGSAVGPYFPGNFPEHYSRR